MTRAHRPRLRFCLAVTLVIGGLITVAGVSAFRGREPVQPAAPAEVVTLKPSRASAVHAAVEALYDLTIPALTDRARFKTAVVRLAAPEAVKHVEAVFGAADPEALEEFGRSGAVLRGAPLGYRIDRYTGDSASIAIWSVAIAATTKNKPASQWRTLVIDLAWTPAGWRVTHGAGIEGPAPSTPLRQLAAEAKGFRSFRYEP